MKLTVIVLAGGDSQRLGGVDKTSIEINGRTMLDRVLAGWPSDARLIVVGPKRPTVRPVTWCRESPPGGGPACAIAAALPLVATELVALVGADMPLLGPAVVPLVDAAATAVANGADGAWLVSSSGRQQPLAACVGAAALNGALPRLTVDQALFPIMLRLSLHEVEVFDDWLLDTDTEADLERVTHLLHRVEGRNHD